MLLGTCQETINSKETERLNFRLWLQRQFTERCKRNPRYSLRAFAKALHLDASSLSQILSGKRPISKKGIQTICKRLSATPADLKAFGLLESSPSTHPDYYQVSLDEFTAISDWYHYAILELTFISGFRPDPIWIARQLSITKEEAKAAIERLKRLGLLLEENKSLVKSARFHTNQSAVNTSSAHRELQRQLIHKALIAVDECQPEEKDITSITMAIDETKLDQARKLIQRFRRDLCALLEDGNQTRVYNFTLQLYPVSKSNQESI
jgi:transcriptional regulator with XRE-family HTH domain